MLENLKRAIVAGAAGLAVALSLMAPAAEAGVVTRNGQGFANANNTSTNPVAPDTLYGAGHQKMIVSTISVGATDSATSIYNVGYLPTNAIIDPSSIAYSTAITGLTSISCGVAANTQPANQQTGTWAASPALFVSAQDWHLAASNSLVQNITTANYHKRLWELLGLSLDPGGQAIVQCTNNSGASGAGTLQFFLKYNDTK
jgi:hypothetical protein